MSAHVLAIDLGGTKIAGAVVDATGNIEHQLITPTPVAGGQEVVNSVLEMIGKLGPERAQAIGAGVPGLAYRDGRVWAPNIPGWESMPLREVIESRFGVPVLVESDRNAFVVGEAWRGAAQGSKDVVFLIIGTGVGTGILADGRLIRGHHELAGAIGWMAVRDEYLPEYQAVGCLEYHAGGPGIGILASRVMTQEMTAREVADLARRGNAQAQEVFRMAGHYLGLALANLVSTLDPEIIVVGGGVADAGELLLRPARQTMQRWGQPLAVKQVRVVSSRLGERAGLLGAAKLAFEFTGTRASNSAEEHQQKAPAHARRKTKS